MSAEGYILVFDIGTTGTKCVLFSPDGTEQDSVTVGYPTRYPAPGWAEQDPGDLWSAVVRGVQTLGRRDPRNLERVLCIGLSGHMNGMLPVDSGGEPVYREIIHSDSRSEGLCADIEARIGGDEFFAITGNRIDAHLSLPKILWFRENCPGEYRRTACFLQSKDFITARLTGRPNLSDYSDASLTCAMNLARREWDTDLLRELSIDKEKFPVLGASHELAGTVCSSAARQTGIASGTPVFRGGGDAACSTRGAGVVAPGQAHMYVGSSAWMTVLAEKPLLDARRRIQNFYDLEGRLCNVCGTVQSAGKVVDWIQEAFGYSEDEAAANGSGLYEYIDTLAGRSPAGAKGLLFLPYLMGERTPHWNQDLRGALIGFSLSHSRSDITRAAFEGVAYGLRNVLDVFLQNGMAPASVTMIGGGADSSLWSQMLCDVLNLEVRISAAPRTATALGAAMSAGVGLGLYASYDEAARMIGITRSMHPDPELRDVYDDHYRLFSSAYEHMVPVFTALKGAVSLQRKGKISESSSS